MKIKKLKSLAAILLSCALIMCSCSNSNSKDSSQDSSVNTTSAVSSLADDISRVNPFEENSSEMDSKKESDITPAMWKVTAKDGTTMTLFGSMHAIKDADYPLPEKIISAYSSADILAVECDALEFSSDINKRYAIAAQMKYTDGTKLKDVISAEAYKGVCHLAEEYNLPMSQLEDMKPWAVSNTIDSYSLTGTDIKTSNAIDGYFLKLAKNDGKEIYEVESAEQQYDLLMNFSLDIYNMMFEGYNYQTKESIAESNEQLYQAWRTGDTETVEKLSTEISSVSGEEIPENEMKLYEDYSDQMLYSRNKVMTEAVEKLLSEKKNVFYVVGAAHFLGEKGIVSLLEKDGYTVERVEY